MMTFCKSRVSDGLCTSRVWGEDHPQGDSPQKLVHNHRKVWTYDLSLGFASDLSESRLGDLKGRGHEPAASH